MRLTIHTFLTLDGVMQGPAAVRRPHRRLFERRLAGAVCDQDMGEIVDGWFHKTDAILLGRTTYELMQPFWSTVTDPDNRVARVLNEATQVRRLVHAPKRRLGPDDDP